MIDDDDKSCHPFLFVSYARGRFFIYNDVVVHYQHAHTYKKIKNIYIYY